MQAPDYNVVEETFSLLVHQPQQARQMLFNELYTTSDKTCFFFLFCSVAAAENGSSLLPLECTYLNKMALHSAVGQQPSLPKHFTLRRKPKSAALRAELIQKGIACAY